MAIKTHMGGPNGKTIPAETFKIVVPYSADALAAILADAAARNIEVVSNTHDDAHAKLQVKPPNDAAIILFCREVKKILIEHELEPAT